MRSSKAKFKDGNYVRASEGTARYCDHPRVYVSVCVCVLLSARYLTDAFLVSTKLGTHG